MPKYYDWNETLSRDADVTMVIGARGLGKTFGIRAQCIRDYIKNGFRFVEVVRFKNELSGVSDGYFNRVGDLFPEYIFRTDARYAYIARNIDSDDDKKIKYEWQKIGYFIALSDAQKMKKRTFKNVRRIVFDEAVLERSDRYHNYLPNEFMTLANLVDTVSRERADTESVPPRLYLLGNACDIANPYFMAYGVGTNIDFGYHWYRDKTFLLHYVDSSDYAQEKLKGTVAGRMLAGTAEGKVSAENKFYVANSDFVAKKPKRAKFRFGIICNGQKYGIWADYTDGLYFITEKLPNNAAPIYSLTASDGRINYIAAKQTSTIFKNFAECYYLGMLRYDSVAIKMSFAKVLTLFGVR